MDDRDNQNKKPTLPMGARLIASSYGSGPNQHLAVLLTLIPSDVDPLLVVWTWNAQTDGVGGGDYVPRNQFLLKASWIQDAWDKFVDRSRKLVFSATSSERSAA